MRQNLVNRILFTAGLAILAITTARPVGGALLTPQEKNLDALSEAMLLTNSMIAQAVGTVPGEILSYDGAFTDSRWSSQLIGTYRAIPVNLAFTGIFDPLLNDGSFTSTGAIGTSSWESSGSWTFADIGQDQAEMTWNSVASFVTPGGIPIVVDRRVSKSWFAVPPFILDVGEVTYTVFGIPVRRRPEVSVYGLVFPLANLRMDMGESVLEATANLTDGTTRGTVATVPESSSAVLVLIGLLAVAAWQPARRVRR